MDDTKRNNIRKYAYLLPLAVLIGVAWFMLRGPYLSNTLKKVILPELELMTGEKVIARKIYVNLFPLFVEADDLKVFDDTGSRILVAPRVKAYVELSGIPARQIKIRRLVLKNPELTTERSQASRILDNVKAYLAKERETAFKVKIRAAEVQGGRCFYRDARGAFASGVEGLDGEVLIGEAQRIRASIKKVSVSKEGWPELSAGADLNASVKGEMVGIGKLTMSVLGSTMTGEGVYSGGKADLKTNIHLMIDTVRKIFGLTRPGEGEVKAKGVIHYANNVVSTDLKVEGKFFIQTLMELLKVKEKVEGLVDIKASLKGPLSNIKGAGTVVMTDGNLFDVEVKRLKSSVSYGDGVMRFSEGKGTLYNGSAKMSASINLPVVNSYTVDVAFSDVDSKPLFKLIGWDPGVPPGKVSGNLLTSGAAFNPAGRFEYRSVESGKDVLGRVKNIAGNYRLEGQLLTLGDLKLRTGISEIAAAGTANLERRSLDFAGTLRTPDVTDLTSPYYTKLKGAGAFSGKITGTFGDPVVGGKVEITNPVYEQYAADVIEANIFYRKDKLDIKDMAVKGKGQSATLSGSVGFKDAKELFDLARPEYNLNATIKNADLDRFARIFYPKFVGYGRLHSDVRIGGTAEKPDLGGRGSVERASVYHVLFDSASFDWNYRNGKLNFVKMHILRGKSSISGDASISTEGLFSYTASSDRLLLSDLLQREIKGEAVFSLRSEGHGSFDDPSIVLDGRIVEGLLKGKPVGGGTIHANIRNKDIALRADLLDGKISLTGKGRLEKELPWETKIEMRTARYDSIISSFLKDVPEDLILSMNGTALLRGDKDHIGGSLTVGQLSLSMYGYSFTNDREISLALRDRTLAMEKISLRSGNMALKLDGSLEMGRRYNLVAEGSSSLSPFKSLSSRIGILKGDADFVLSVTGDWDNPVINGGITMKNGSFGLKDYPYRLSSLNGYLYMDNDRVVLQGLSGKLGGGDVDLSGILYLKKFSFNRFYVEAALKNITVSPSNDFTVNFGGNILYKGTPASQVISGDVLINRARYRERVEWKSWLLKTQKAVRYKTDISGLEKAELNVRIAGKDNIYIDNNVARATVSADMILRGWVYRPLLFGRLETADGTVYFRNNEFRIIHASVGFFDPNRINPVVEIASETDVKGYKIKMNLEGQLDRFNVSLSSDPVLKEMDILSLLAVGQTGGNLKGLEGGIGAGEATSFVTGKLQDVVEERMRSITGLDRFQIDPHVSKTTGTVEPSVTVSKRLLGDKVFVTYTSSVGSAQDQIVKVEYFLSKKLSLVGLRDERGILGGDLRFRFEFK